MKPAGVLHLQQDAKMRYFMWCQVCDGRQSEIHLRTSPSCCPYLHWPQWPSTSITYSQHSLQQWSEKITICKGIEVISYLPSWVLLGGFPAASRHQAVTKLQGCKAGVCTTAPSAPQQIQHGAGRGAIGPSLCFSGMTARGQVILGHSWAPDANSEATELKYKCFFPLLKPSTLQAVVTGLDTAWNKGTHTSLGLICWFGVFHEHCRFNVAVSLQIRPIYKVSDKLESFPHFK